MTRLAAILFVATVLAGVAAGLAFSPAAGAQKDCTPRLSVALLFF